MITIISTFHSGNLNQWERFINYSKQNKSYQFICVYNESLDFKVEKTDNLIMTPVLKTKGKIHKLLTSLKHIKNEYIFVFDPDDEIDFNALDNFADHLTNSKNKPNLVINTHYKYNSDMKLISHSWKIKSKNKYFKYSKKLRHSRYGHPFENASCIFKKDVFEHAVLRSSKNYDEILGQDIVLGLSAMNYCKGKRVSFVNIPFYIHVRFLSSNSKSTYSNFSFSLDSYTSNLKTLRKIYEYKGTPFFDVSFKIIVYDLMYMLNSLPNSLSYEIIKKSTLFNKELKSNKVAFYIKTKDTIIRRRTKFNVNLDWKKNGEDDFFIFTKNEISEVIDKGILESEWFQNKKIIIYGKNDMKVLPELCSSFDGAAVMTLRKNLSRKQVEDFIRRLTIFEKVRLHIYDGEKKEFTEESLLAIV